MASKFKTFAFFLFSTALWTFAFGASKYYLWAYLKDSLAVSLEDVAGSLALWSSAAYFFGGVVMKRFGIRLVLSFSAFAAAALFTFGWQFGHPSKFALLLSVFVFGFLYGLWVVWRSVLSSLEIGKTGMSDTAVTGSMNATFIVSVIVGSVLGSVLAEKFWISGHVALVSALVLAGLISFGFSGKTFDGDPSVKAIELVTGLSKWKTVFLEYWQLLFAVSFLWALSTVASQQVIQSSVALFSKTPAEAATVLLYSSVGAIVGNVLSAKLAKVRWKAFHVANGCFVLALAAIPTVFEKAAAAGTYSPVIAIAVAIGLFFGLAANLAEGLYFKNLESTGEKEYGSSLYGIVLSSTLALVMAVVWHLSRVTDWKNVFFILAFGAAFASLFAAFESARRKPWMSGPASQAALENRPVSDIIRP